MTDKLDFSVPEAGKKNHSKKMKGVYILLSLLLVFSIFNTVTLFKGRSIINKNSSSLTPTHKELKQLALKLEKQGLSKQAVHAWKEYLATFMPEAVESSKIWYRIGTIYQANGDFDNALDAYYRSESFSKPDEIKDDINRKIQECLESAGRFAALRYELGERVGENNSSSGPGEDIVAEIGSEKITRSDLDTKIEKLIESRISGLSRYLPPDRINREKENLLKQYSSENGRRVFLEQFIIEEMLYRKAREARLSDDKSVRDALKDMERSFLASRVLEKAYVDEINITATDVNNHYKANKKKYIKKEEDETERQMEFEEVKDRVAMDLMSEKERDVQRKVIMQLKEKYNVVIHNVASPAENDTQTK